MKKLIFPRQRYVYRNYLLSFYYIFSLSNRAYILICIYFYLQACPLCGVRRFSTQSNAVAHVESGACTSCQGREQAQQQVYNFVARNNATRGFLSTAAIEYHGQGNTGIPENPYECPICKKNFRMISGMMNHHRDVHGRQHGGQNRSFPAITFQYTQLQRSTSNRRVAFTSVLI